MEAGHTGTPPSPPNCGSMVYDGLYDKSLHVVIINYSIDVQSWCSKLDYLSAP